MYQINGYPFILIPAQSYGLTHSCAKVGIFWTERGKGIAQNHYSYRGVLILITYVPILVRLDCFSHSITVFLKRSAIQECQCCQLGFSCAIKNELDQWSLQSWNVIFVYELLSNFTFTNNQMVLINKETTNIWDYKVGNNGNIANFVCLWKNPFNGSIDTYSVRNSLAQESVSFQWL